MTDEAEHLLRSELNSLKAQIDTLKRQLENVEPRVRQMEPAVRMIEINNGNPEPISPAFGEAPIPQLWGEDPKPWAVEWEPRENGGNGSWLIYLPETGSFKENTLTPSLDSAFSTMRSNMESSTARPNTSWMVLEVSSSSASTVYLSITKPSEGTPTMTISTSAATGAINFPIAATAANHTVSQYLFGELAIGGDGGGGGGEEYCADSDSRVGSGCSSIERQQYTGEPKFFSLFNFNNDQARFSLTAKLDANDEAGYYGGDAKSIVPKYTYSGSETSYLDLLMRTFHSSGSKMKTLEYGRLEIRLPKLPQGDGKSVGITTTSSTSGTTAKYGLKDFANPTIVVPQAFSLNDGAAKNIASGADMASQGDEALVCILVRTNSGELQYRRVSIYGRSDQDLENLIANYFSSQSSGGPTYDTIRQWIDDAIEEALEDGGDIKSAIADAVEEAIKAHEQKAESWTFANSHVP